LHKKLAALFETAANVCQYGAIVTAIVGASVAYRKLDGDRRARAEARAEKARSTPRELAHPELLASSLAAFSNDNGSGDVARTVFQVVHWGTQRHEERSVPLGMAVYFAPHASERTKVAAKELASGLVAASGATDVSEPAEMPSLDDPLTIKTIELMIGAKSAKK
jgi:hypothetical protein